MSLPDRVDTRNTPVRTSCLSFEQTPIQPEGTLVPDSDSDEDRGGVADRRHKAVGMLSLYICIKMKPFLYLMFYKFMFIILYSF